MRMPEEIGLEEWTSFCPALDTLSDSEIFGGFLTFVTEVEEVSLSSIDLLQET